MVFESFVPTKKKSIGFADGDKKSSNAPITAAKSAPTNSFSSFLSGLGSGGLNLTVKKNAAVKIKRRSNLVQKLRKYRYDSRFALLKHVSIEANFNLHPLFKNSKDYMSIVQTQWVYPESTIQFYSQNDASNAINNNSVNKEEFWSQHENKGNITSSEKHVNFVKSLYLKWQQALFSVVDMLIDNQINVFHIIGESMTSDIAIDNHHTLFVSAVFKRTPAGDYSCVLMGVNKALKKRLVELGARVEAEKSDKTI